MLRETAGASLTGKRAMMLIRLSSYRHEIKIFNGKVFYDVFLKKDMPEFTINHLDHIAINVSDPATSIAWYERVLGLRKLALEKWGNYPVFMLAGTVGIAIFKAKEATGPTNSDRSGVSIDHFAFNLSQEDFKLARQHYDTLGLQYQFQNHHYFHSLYTKDPDGHVVELTTAVAELPGV